MGTVEIYIKDNKVQRIEGHNAIVFVYDDDVEHPIQMEFKRQGADYEDYKSARHYTIIVLNIFSIAVMQEQSRRNGLAFHICFLPLQLFIGFNISNRWIL